MSLAEALAARLEDLLGRCAGRALSLPRRAMALEIAFFEANAEAMDV
jgi:hypothetical protein